MTGFSLNMKLYGMMVALSGTGALIAAMINYLQLNWNTTQTIINTVFAV